MANSTFTPGNSTFVTRQLPIASRQSPVVDAFTGHELWAESYDEFPNPLLPLEERQLSELLPNLRNLVIADIACGTGRWMKQALKMGAKSVVGVDFSPAMLAQAAQEPGLQGCLVLGTIQHIPLKTSAADILICAFALGYLQGLRSIASEFHRILKPGGFLYCSDLHPTAHQRGWTRSFKHGLITFNIEHTPHPEADILSSFSGYFHLEKKLDLPLGDPERAIFERAGKMDAFQQIKDLPAVILFHWQKPG